MQYDVNKMHTDVTSALGNEYMGCDDTERILTETLGFEMEQYDQYIDDGCDYDEEVGGDKYVMCSAFRAKQYDNPIVVRIYYGDVTEEIGYVEIHQY
jgi:hypothetical protein